MTTEQASPTDEPFRDANEIPERALQIYTWLWQFETWLRRMVYVELRAKSGDRWSENISGGQGSFKSDKALTHMPTPEMNALSYCQLGKLAELIERDWHCFATYFPPKTLWEAKLTEIAQIRHRMAHFRVGHVDDGNRLAQFLRDTDRGFWTFVASYNDGHPVLPQTDDAVTARFLPLDPLPWSELEPGRWARFGTVDRSAPIGVTVAVLRRPWASASVADGTEGYLYDIMLHANDRMFDYPAVLEATRSVHDHFCHIGLAQLEDSIRLTIPAVLGSARVIELVETFMERARYGLTRVRPAFAPKPQELADEWPEYIIGPRDSLMYLPADAKGRFFSM